MKNVTTNKQIRIIRILITAAVLFAAVLILPAAAADPAQYTLTYDANGQTVTVPDSVTAADGSVIFILAPELTDTGTKQFNGWNNKSDGTGKYYYPGGKFTIKSNIILYAQWINKTVNFSVVVKENNVWTASPAKKYRDYPKTPI